MREYTSREMMAVAAAREIRDGDIVFCGTGISILAAMAAKHISAPNSVIIFETGAVDPRLEEIPLAVSDSRIMLGTSVNGGLADVFAILQNPISGRHVVGILGAAQIDRYGNLNSTAIGPYAAPSIRFPGSGGACDMASSAGRMIIFMEHERRRFIPQLDYLTSPGWLGGPQARRHAGLAGGGPIAVITNLAIMRFDEETKQMVLSGCYPGISSRMILDHTGFEMEISQTAEVPPPTSDEIRILREVCDPQRLILGP